MREKHGVARVKWASEPEVVEVSYDDTYGSSTYVNEPQKTPLKPSLKQSTKPSSVLNVPLSEDAASPTPRAVELLEWAKTRLSIITSVQPEEDWRERGSRLRSRLVKKDEECGGNAFTLSNKCKIERYFDVAERVLEQFLSVSVNDTAELTESYLVGNRLVKFLSLVLPGHKKYFSDDPNIWELRTKSQKQLVQLLLYLERLALVIDEDEYNKYILSDLQAKESKKGPPKVNETSAPTKTSETADLTDSFIDAHRVNNIDTYAEEGDSGESSALFPFASFSSASSPDRNGFPHNSLLGDSDHGASEDFSDVFDSSFTKQSLSRLFVTQDDSLVKRKPPVNHSHSWDDSFTQFAKHHEKPPQLIKKKKIDKIRRNKQTLDDGSGERDVFDMVNEWGDKWTPGSGFEEPQNVFRRQTPKSGLESYKEPRDFNSAYLSQQEAKQLSLHARPQNTSKQHSKESSKPQYVHPKTMQQLKEVDKVRQLEERQQSPKSIAELPQWVSWDEASSSIAASSTSSPPGVSSSYIQLSGHEFLQITGRGDGDDDDDSSGVHSGEETHSLTRGVITHPRNTSGPMRHIKGCVKCLMD